jgi:hypothetical protein
VGGGIVVGGCDAIYFQCYARVYEEKEKKNLSNFLAYTRMEAIFLVDAVKLGQFIMLSTHSKDEWMTHSRHGGFSLWIFEGEKHVKNFLKMF